MAWQQERAGGDEYSIGSVSARRSTASALGPSHRNPTR